MNAKQKAIELVDKYRTYVRIADKYDLNLGSDEIHIAKQCALICVNKMIEQNGELFLQGINLEYYTKANAFLFEIKTEIELL